MKKKIILTILLLVASWIGGFFYFLKFSKSYASDRSTTDAIVVLSGGRLRIKTGLELLKAGYAPVLFISGTDSTEQLKKTLIMQGVRQEQIIYGNGTDSTKASAREIYDFTTSHNILTIRLVTAYYHMPRAMEEMRKVVPAKIKIIPHIVNTEGYNVKVLLFEYAQVSWLFLSSFFK